MDYDVIIAGGSFAGLAVANQLRGQRVLLIDRKPIGSGRTSACGTIWQTLNRGAGILILGRPRGDMWEVGLWEDNLTVVGEELFYNYQVYNQAIVVPETIDAIRALTSAETDGAVSMSKTDTALGLMRTFP